MMYTRTQAGKPSAQKVLDRLPAFPFPPLLMARVTTEYYDGRTRPQYFSGSIRLLLCPCRVSPQKIPRRRATGVCRVVAVRVAHARANREAYRKYPDTKQGIGLPKTKRPAANQIIFMKGGLIITAGIYAKCIYATKNHQLKKQEADSERRADYAQQK